MPDKQVVFFVMLTETADEIFRLRRNYFCRAEMQQQIIHDIGINHVLFIVRLSIHEPRIVVLYELVC